MTVLSRILNLMDLQCFAKPLRALARQTPTIDNIIREREALSQKLAGAQLKGEQLHNAVDMRRHKRDVPHRDMFPDEATTDDIHYCFRLLLGRRPNREEMAGHFSKVGWPLSDVVAGYLRSVEFSNRGLLTLTPYKSLKMASLDGFSIWADQDDQEVGRHVLNLNYEPHVTKIVRA